MAILVGQSVLTGFTLSDDIYGASSGEWVQQFAAVETGVAGSISIYIADWNTTSSAKLRLRNEAGDLLDEATINSTDGTGTITATLSGGVTLTSGQNYKLTFTPDAGYLKPYNNDNGWVIRYAGGSSYATAEDPLGSSSSAANGEVAIWVESTAPQADTIDSTTTVRLGESFTATTNGATDLTTATTITATLGGITLTGQANVLANSVDFTAPSGGLELGASHDLVLTIDGTPTAAFSVAFNPPTGKDYITLSSVDTNSWLNDPAYNGNAGGDANNVGASDQIVYDSSTSPDAFAVSIDNAGLITVTNAGSALQDQTIDWFYLDAQDSYAASGSQTLTVLLPTFRTVGITGGTIRAGDTVTITVAVPEGVMSLSCSAGAITVDSQDSTSLTFTCPDPVTFGTKTLNYSAPITLTVNDGTNTDTIDLTIEPSLGFQFGQITSIDGSGIYSDDVGVSVGNYGYAEVLSGNATVDIATGAVTNTTASQIRSATYDGTWSDFDTDTYAGNDTEDPVITLNGDDPLTWVQGTAWVDPQATVTDNVDSTSQIDADNTPDINTVGSYTLNYNYTDAAGNAATQVQRTVNVVLPDATELPTISPTSGTSLNIYVGTGYADPLWTWSDDVVSGQPVTWTGDSVDINTAGTYTRTATATNAVGSTILDYTINILEVPQNPPVPDIKLNGINPINIIQGTTFNDPLVTATDEIDGDISANVQVTGTVDTNAVGAYELTYSVTNSLGETASVTRVVNVFTPVAFTPLYQWYRDGVPIAGANDATYAPTADDIGADLSRQATMITTTVLN